MMLVKREDIYERLLKVDISFIFTKCIIRFNTLS